MIDLFGNYEKNPKSPLFFRDQTLKMLTSTPIKDDGSDEIEYTQIIEKRKHGNYMYRTLRACIDDLLKTGRMVRVIEPVDSHLEIAAIQRRVFANGGPALYFENVHNSGISCEFPMVSNLYGTMERLEYIFRDALESIRLALEWGADPISEASERFVEKLRIIEAFPLSFSLLKNAWYAKPKKVRTGPVFKHETTLDRLPQLVSWPDDGGPFVTLPLVYTESPNRPGTMHSNLGMYRVQIAGNRYKKNEEAGLHYQIHRGIAAHHLEAIEKGEPLKVNVFIGGAPSMTLAAVMPFPEGLSELIFAGMLGRHRVPMAGNIYTEADFCISGHLELDRTLPEGPFGDHLGYYSLSHDFPVFKIERVWHRPDPIWPFTVVGRPPQEDTMFGKFIHELTGSAIPKKLPGVRAVHAVDAAGVHPLLLAIGSERYHPFSKTRRAAELHTLAHSILGYGQLSLAKYLFIAAGEDDPNLDVNDIVRFFMHVLERVDWREDLIFSTKTTCDTLDYSGGELSRGSKLIVCACGKPKRELASEIPNFLGFPNGYASPKLIFPGVMIVEKTDKNPEPFDPSWCDPVPLIVVVDETGKVNGLDDFLWTCFTKSDPACDVEGSGSFIENKHWGCTGPLIIDARKKPHHAPELIEDTKTIESIKKLASSGGSLHGLF